MAKLRPVPQPVPREVLDLRVSVADSIKAMKWLGPSDEAIKALAVNLAEQIEQRLTDQGVPMRSRDRHGEFVQEDRGRLGAEVVTRLLRDPDDTHGAVTALFVENDPRDIALSLLNVVGGLLAELVMVQDCELEEAWERAAVHRACWAADRADRGEPR